MAKRALSSPFIKHMDIEYARLARDLPLPTGITTAPRANVIENAAPSYKSPNAVVSEEVSVFRIGAHPIEIARIIHFDF